MRSIFSFSFLCILCVLCGNSFAQVRATNDQGALGLGQLLKRINTTGSVMLIGAHPDDEDSALLAYLARGENARTAYLSLTRGDGGQNILGPELFESLGVIRTEELLQARRLDGAEQYFTRAFDYGFSKTLAEARAKWPEDVILCDAVRAIRKFRPLVAIARFTGTPADGHGQHQYSGYLAPIAVRAAADPKQCTAAGDAWQVKKFYVEQGFRGGGDAGVKYNTGTYDPLLGRSYFEIAMEGRSQHKSQEQGLLELHGAQYSGLNLAENPKKEKGIFDGLDISISGIAANTVDRGTEKLSELNQLAAKITSQFDAFHPKMILPDLAKGYALSHSMRLAAGASETKAFLERKENEFAEAARIAGGIQIEALADKETVIPGADFSTNVKVFFPEGTNFKVKEITLQTPQGWAVAKTAAPQNNQQGFFRRETGNEEAFFTVKVAAGEKPTEPYWLESDRKDAMYAWPNAPDEKESLAFPFQAPLVTAQIKMDIEGQEVVFTHPVEYRYADSTRGELRRELNVVPAVSLNLDQKLLAVPLSDKPQTRRVIMTVTNNSAGAVSGVANMASDAPGELKFATANGNFELKNKGEKISIAFDVTIPARAKTGIYSISAQAKVGESTYSQEMHTIAYPHIQTHRFYTRAATKVSVLDLKTAPVKVGYIMGSGEEVPEAIKQMGFDVTMLDAKELSSGDLSRFGTIVVGIRASETRPDFVAHNNRLMDYVKNGGVLLVQYQRPEYAQKNLVPFPTQMGSRVVDENARVTILDPANAVFNFPNKIGDADFAGWVQERNLYNFDGFDAAYKPLLESHDEGEKENTGGLVVADMGKGKYVYCSYAFFRQLPAGVPGAYRLFANLLSLGNKK